MKKDNFLIIIIVILALALGILGGKMYFDSIKDDKTEEKPNDNKKDDNNISTPSENKITSIMFIEINSDTGSSTTYEIKSEYYDKINNIITNAKEDGTVTGVGINNRMEISYSDKTKKTIILISNDSFIYMDSDKLYRYNSADDLNNFLPSTTEQIKKLFGQELTNTVGIVDYNITSCEKIDSAGNLYIYKIVYDFKYNDKFIGSDRVVGTDTVNDKSMYVTVMLENGKYNIIESTTGYGNKISAKEKLGKLAFIKYLKSIKGVTNYRIKQCNYEKNIGDELVFHIVFDVQSNPIMDAGNGTITSDNWVENKDVWVQMIEENGTYVFNKEKGMNTTEIN